MSEEFEKRLELQERRQDAQGRHIEELRTNMSTLAENVSSLTQAMQNNIENQKSANENMLRAIQESRTEDKELWHNMSQFGRMDWKFAAGVVTIVWAVFFAFMKWSNDVSKQVAVNESVAEVRAEYVDQYRGKLLELVKDSHYQAGRLDALADQVGEIDNQGPRVWNKRP